MIQYGAAKNSGTMRDNYIRDHNAIHTYIHKYIHTYIRAYLHTYIHRHTYIHAYHMQAYTSTCMRAYMLT